MPISLKQQFPFRLMIGNEDATFLLDDAFTFSSVDPGGFEAASFSIPKDMPQTLRGTPVRLDCGLKVAWEGRVAQIQRSLGHRTQINCEGYGALLKDNAMSMVFVDRDITRFQAPSLTRQIALGVANFQLGSSQVAADPTSNTPAFAQTITDSWATPNKPVCESLYDAGPGNLIAKVYYDHLLSASVNVADVNWQGFVLLYSDANGSSAQSSANLDIVSETSAYFAPSTAWRFAVLQHFYNATASGTAGDSFSAYWKKLAVYGNHGLTGRGTDPVGFYPSDIAGYVIGHAPGLRVGNTQATDVTGYIVPHSVYYTPVTSDQVMNDMAKAGGWHWGVWESLSPLTGDPTPRCDFMPRPTLGQFSAFCLRRDTEQCDIREDLSQQYNQAVVTFTQVDGTDGAVTVTMDNPILDQAGIPVRTVILNGGTMTPATAAVFGAETLALLYAQGRVAGSVQIDTAITGGGGLMPGWLLKPGIDRLRIGDLPSFDAFGAYNDVPLSRMEFSGSSAGFLTSLEVGSGGNLVETLQARLAASTALAAQGGV